MITIEYGRYLTDGFDKRQCSQFIGHCQRCFIEALSVDSFAGNNLGKPALHNLKPL